jgi:hypothetical protein
METESLPILLNPFKDATHFMPIVLRCNQFCRGCLCLLSACYARGWGLHDLGHIFIHVNKGLHRLLHDPDHIFMSRNRGIRSLSPLKLFVLPADLVMCSSSVSTMGISDVNCWYSLKRTYCSTLLYLPAKLHAPVSNVSCCKSLGCPSLNMFLL